MRKMISERRGVRGHWNAPNRMKLPYNTIFNIDCFIHNYISMATKLNVPD